MNTPLRTTLGLLAVLATAPGLLAQTATTPASIPSTEAAEEEIITLSPFEVRAESDSGYQATQTLAGSRINTRLEDVGSAISVVTSEFLRDVGATDNKSLLAYTTNTEVGGSQGNFRGASGGQNEDESGRFTNPNGNTRVRGLTSADNTRNFFITDVPWDGYNIDRVDMQRGPNSILFGLGSPAGIINTTTKAAQHRDFREVELRFGSYGSNRAVVDINQNLLEDELSIRLNLLRNEEKYRQHPAYSLDRRVFATLRYDPKFLSRNGHKTSLKVNFENGDVRSNNPRTITPIDAITPWWDNLNRTAYNPNLVQYRGKMYNADQTTYYAADRGWYEKTRDDGSANPGYQPYLGAPQFYGGIWMPVDVGQTVPSSYQMPEYRNWGGLNSSGTRDGSIGGLPFSRRVSVATTAYYAERNSALPYQSWGVWKSKTLSDASVFDFYNNLIDGDNKEEWQNFDNISVSLSQTFFDDKMGFEAAYDHQNYDRGQYSFNGSGTLYVDINSHNADGTPNANFGKPYIESNYVWGNSATDFTRESARLNAFFDHNFNKRGDGAWYKKLLGRHTLSGLLSTDMVESDARGFSRYGTPDSFAALVSSTPATADARLVDSNDRQVSSTIYLGESLAGASTYKDAFIPRAGAQLEIPQSAQWRYFDSTWTAPASVSPGAEWINSYNGQKVTQSENPANYAGWKTTSVDILSAENDRDRLTRTANLNRREVESRAAVWQAYLWDGAVVGMYGLRHDKVKSWAYEATRVNNRVNFAALDKDGKLQYSTDGKAYNLYEATSPSWSVVAKLNKFVGDWLPVNVSLFYNESENFQIAGTRNNIYGQPLAAPSGETTDQGIMISTKDGRFSLKVNKYETTVLNSGNSVLNNNLWFLLGSGNFIQRNEDRADAYEYHLTELGNPNSVADTGSVTGTWTWKYAPRGSETQEQADANAAAAVAAWRAYTKEPLVQKILQAWGFNDFSKTQTTTMATPVANFTATEDQISKGWEYEFTANPTSNWRITINASETKAQRNNVGGADLQEFVELTNTYQNGPMGDIRQWGGGQNSLPPPSLNSWNLNFYSKYLLMKLQEGTYSTELRRWRFNIIQNYSFSEGFLKGVNIGAGYRWQDKIALGYPLIPLSASKVTFDIANPYYGPSDDAIDLWIGYHRKLTSKVDWRIQLNVRNVGDGKKLIPLSVQYDGSIAAWGIAPSQSWTVTNTFSF
jgi:hypothetical protein